MQNEQQQVARIMLEATEHFGFVLAGGYAIVLHGVGTRQSEDIDVFTNRIDPERFADAVDHAVKALRSAGWEAEIIRQTEAFARLRAVRGEVPVDIDMGVDFRERPPARMAIGPVLSLRDAAGSKMIALYGRGLVRDYVDVYELLRSGRVTEDQLLAWGDAREATPMDRMLLKNQLAAVVSISQRQFDRYQVAATEADTIRSVLAAWGQAIADQTRS